MKAHRLLPRLLECLRCYTRADLGADLVAGLTVGLVALPLGMAFAISSGMPPQSGLYTAILAGLVVSGLGGSRYQIAGPTGAFVVIVAGIIAKFGVPGLLMCTMMAGVILIAMALTGLGATVRFIPRPVTIGFTNGIAVLIASTQVKDFFGLKLSRVPGEFAERVRALAEHAGTVSGVTTAVAAASLAIILIFPKVSKRVPGSIVALFGATLACALAGLNVETIGSRFGGIPSGLPGLAIPTFRPEMVLPLVPAAFTVAMLAAIESLLSAVVADTMTGDHHRPDAELLAQGIANVLSPLVGGLPVTGAIARTATGIRSGARSPLTGIVHALTLLAIVLVAAPLARWIPLAALAAILTVVSYNMGEWREIPGIVRTSAADAAVWGVTFALTVFAYLTVAVSVGMGMAAILYIRKVAETTSVEPVTPEYIADGQRHILQGKLIPPYVLILRIHGPFLFGVTHKLEEATPDVGALPPIVILRLRNMTALDGTGLHAIEHLAMRLAAQGRTLIVCGTRKQPMNLLLRSSSAAIAGNMQPSFDAALVRARELFAENSVAALAS